MHPQPSRPGELLLIVFTALQIKSPEAGIHADPLMKSTQPTRHRSGPDRDSEAGSAYTDHSIEPTRASAAHVREFWCHLLSSRKHFPLSCCAVVFLPPVLLCQILLVQSVLRRHRQFERTPSGQQHPTPTAPAHNASGLRTLINSQFHLFSSSRTGK